MKRILFVPAVPAALILTGCGSSGPECKAPLVAVDHGHTEYIPITHMVGKMPIVQMTPVWRSDWHCEERGTK